MGSGMLCTVSCQVLKDKGDAVLGFVVKKGHGEERAVGNEGEG